MWNVPCSRLSRLSCGECKHFGWCYFQSRTVSLTSQTHPSGSAEHRMYPAHLWKDGTRYLLRMSPRPRSLRYGNDPCVLKRRVTGRLLMRTKENSAGARKCVFGLCFSFKLLLLLGFPHANRRESHCYSEAVLKKESYFSAWLCECSQYLG